MSTFEDVRAFACRNVWERHAPILQVCHDDSGDWQFLCGGNEHTTPDEAVVIHAHHMFDLYPELQEVADLTPGFYAWRTSSTAPWERYKTLDEADG